MIQKILEILNKKYEKKLTAKPHTGDYDFYFNGKPTNVSLTDGDKGEPESVAKIVEREIDFFLLGKIEKINITEEQNGTKELSDRSSHRRKRKHRKNF